MTITCADCGSTQTIPVLPPRGIAECHRCDRMLDRRSWTRFDVTFFAAAGMLILLFPAMFLPFLQSTIKHLVFQESRLISSVPVIYREVWLPFALGFLFFAFVFPAIRAILLLVVLGAIRLHKRPREIGRFFRWQQELRIWSMTEVVVVAGVLTYFRAAVPAQVSIRSGAWCYLAVAVLYWVSDWFLDRRGTWNAILPDREAPPRPGLVSCGVCEMTMDWRRSGDPCPRCGARLDRDLTRTFPALLALFAATIPLIPLAYSYSVIVNEQLTGVWEYTVLGTIQLLADRGQWQFGVVVLVAGVLIPFLALFALLWLLTRIYLPSRRGLVFETRLYRLLHRLVRWPMIIPFIAAIAAPIVNYPGIDDIFAGPGATPFFGLVVLIMLAIRIFEPRLMWREVGEAR
ncbi:MAG: paraquat-inducible protein A [Thermoanaerobaculia bacterium]